VAGLIGATTVIVVGGLAWLVPVFRLPAPSGPYGIGTITWHWTDASRDELFSVDGGKREIAGQAWYPSPVTTKQGGPYVDDARALSANLVRVLSANGLLRLPPFTFNHFSLIRTHALVGSPVAPERFPVLIFLSGLGGFRQSNMAQVERLVSHGFVVIGLDQP